MISPTEFWQRLATRSQSNLYFALVFLPADRREAFRDVYRFLRAADDVADAEAPEAEKREKLAAWRRELAAVYAGTASHPIALRLAETVQRFGLSRAHFETILGALEDDVAPRVFRDDDELERWCEAMSSTLGYLCLEILGCDGAETRAYARQLGVALQLANIVRDVAEDAKRGRVYLSVAELRAAGCEVEDVLAGVYSPAFARVEARYAGRVRACVAAARGHLAGEARRKLLVPEIWADVYLALLRELERERFDVFKRRPYLKRRKKLAIACVRWLESEREVLLEAVGLHHR